MSEYGKTKKKLVFYSDDHTHAKLIVKFMEDNIKQMAFFHEFVKAYINDDPTIRKWIDDNPKCRVSKRCMAKRKREKKLIEKQQKEFNLDKEVVDELFDILADEFGD